MPLAINIPTTLSREYLLVSGSGAYCAGTLSGCNTRKYHGLLAEQQANNEYHVLLSSLEETVIAGDQSWLLDTHRYSPGILYPEGFRLISRCNTIPVPQWTFRCGDIEIQKTILLTEQKVLLIRYTLAGPAKNVVLRLKPLLACRNAHGLQHASSSFNMDISVLPNGARFSNALFMHSSGTGIFKPDPSWYYNTMYSEEQARGYDHYEDLWCPGQFEINISSGRSVILAASSTDCAAASSEKYFNRLLETLPRPGSFYEKLELAAHQFLIRGSQHLHIKAGYYWFGEWGRDTCIALPGLTLLNGNHAAFLEITGNLLKDMQNGLIPNTGSGPHAQYNAADVSLWFIHALQQYDHFSAGATNLWEVYGPSLRHILENYLHGTSSGIGVQEDGLLAAEQDGQALTWMDAVYNGIPMTQRAGKPVELNALWYNAVCFCLQLAHTAEDRDFLAAWAPYAEKVRHAFLHAFWDEEKQYLADCVHGDTRDWSVRPNQVLAVSLPYSPVPGYVGKAIMDKVRNELLTPRGLRTLSPQDPRYCGHYGGDQYQRDAAYHQGTVWPWLLGHFTEASCKVYGKDALPQLREIYAGMENTMQEYCMQTIPEVFDGDPPYKPGGAVAQAWSVAELLRMKYLIEQYASVSVNETPEIYTAGKYPSC